MNTKLKNTQTLFIDGDGCNIQTRQLAERLSERGVNVTIVANRVISKTRNQTNFVQCDSIRDGADLFITAKVKEGDLVITRDLALAKLLLEKLSGQIDIISDIGEHYTLDIIDARIARALHSKERRKNMGKIPFSEDTLNKISDEAHGIVMDDIACMENSSAIFEDRGSRHEKNMPRASGKLYLNKKNNIKKTVKEKKKQHSKVAHILENWCNGVK